MKNKDIIMKKYKKIANSMGGTFYTDGMPVLIMVAIELKKKGITAEEYADFVRKNLLMVRT